MGFTSLLIAANLHLLTLVAAPPQPMAVMVSPRGAQPVMSGVSSGSGVSRGASGQLVFNRSPGNRAVSASPYLVARTRAPMDIPTRGAGLPGANGRGNIHDRRPPSRFTTPRNEVAVPFPRSGSGPAITIDPSAGAQTEAFAAVDGASSYTSGFGEASSFSLAAAYSDDRWSLGISISSAVTDRLFWDSWRPSHSGFVCPPSWSWANSGWSTWPWWWNSTSLAPIGYDAPTALATGRLDPNLNPWYTPEEPGMSAPEAETPAPPIEALDAAIYAIGNGNFELALRILKPHVSENPEDAAAQRVLGIVHLLRREFDQGFRSIGQAYRNDPSLADRPLFAGDLLIADDTWRSMRLRSLQIADARPSADSIITSIALLQTHANRNNLPSMIDRASVLGVPAELVGRFRQSIGQPNLQETK